MREPALHMRHPACDLFYDGESPDCTAPEIPSRFGDSEKKNEI